MLKAIPIALVAALLPLISIEASAQQDLGANIFQAPQVVRFAAPMQNITSPKVDPATLIRIPVTVQDDAGQCVDSLDARDFSLSVDGEESPIALFRSNHTTAAALGVLVDVSQGMSFKSWRGGLISKVPLAQEAIQRMIDKLDAHDSVFLATFARRFHMLDDFTTDHSGLEERLPLLRPTDELDDFHGDGIYESMIKGITVLTHAPKSCERRALMVFTSAWCDSSTHGAEDVVAKAQFAGVTIYNIIVLGFKHEADTFSIRNGMGRIAAETGGRTFMVDLWSGPDPVIAAADEIASELDSQYLLGFSASPWGPHALPIELMLPNHPGLHAQTERVVRFRPSDFVSDVSMPTSRGLPE
jgi:VWFA-related protein